SAHIFPCLRFESNSSKESSHTLLHCCLRASLVWFFSTAGMSSSDNFYPAPFRSSGNIHRRKYRLTISRKRFILLQVTEQGASKDMQLLEARA
ncbi:hypothetical protein PFISCL1PPCAC_7122, partial [Pristionchus fissidentatus]